MQKTYWWRNVVIGVCSLILISAFFVSCEQKIGKCIGGNSIPIVRSLFHFSLAFLITSPLLFFINDNVFLKWFRFALVWFSLAAIFIFFAPVYSGNIVGNPTKESISIWMGSLFVILSLGQFVWYWNKSKK